MSSHAEATTSPRVAYSFTSMRRFPLLTAMSGRELGSPDDGDVGYTPSNDHARIDANRDAFLTSIGVAKDALTLGRQVHGTHVEVVGPADRGRGRPPRFDGFPCTDALVTSERNVVLGTIVADCVPVVIYDPRQHVVGIAHAGWRGTVGLICANLVETLARNFGSRPQDLVAGIGPSIGPCCYEVGHDVVAAWRASEVVNADDALLREGQAFHFDLWQANRAALICVGVPNSAIEISGICSMCNHERFFSYRAFKAGIGVSGRMMMVVQLGEPA